MSASFLLLSKFLTLLTIACQELTFTVNMGALERCIMLGYFRIIRIYEPVKKNMQKQHRFWLHNFILFLSTEQKSPKYIHTIGAHLAPADFACFLTDRVSCITGRPKTNSR